MLNERFSLYSCSTLTLAFTGTVLVLYGQQCAASAAGGSIYALLLLLVNPLIIAVGVIAMRQMRKMHVQAVTTYMNLMLLVLMVAIAVKSGSNLITPLLSFSRLDWVVLVCLSGANVVSQIFRFKAI